MIDKRILHVSFPRSGNGFLRMLLVKILKDELVHFDPYMKKLKGSDVGDSTNIREANFIKTHDFHLRGTRELKMQFPGDRKYLVQIRHPLPAIVSFYEFSLATDEIKDDSRENWVGFLESRLEYWKRFVALWVEGASDDRLIVRYEELVENPLPVLRDVVPFISPGKEVDISVMERAIATTSKINVFPKTPAREEKVRDVTKFRYFDETHFRKMEERVGANQLRDLALPVLFS